MARWLEKILGDSITGDEILLQVTKIVCRPCERWILKFKNSNLKLRKLKSRTIVSAKDARVFLKLRKLRLKCHFIKKLADLQQRKSYRYVLLECSVIN